MNDLITTEREEIMHWIWDNFHYDFMSITTVEGLPVHVINKGTVNSSDGPDIINADLLIGEMRWRGDIEIHWREQDWNRHRHHLDRNYNRVILHLVYHPPHSLTAVRQDGTKIQTACLKDFLDPALIRMIDRFKRDTLLPCSGIIAYISEGALKSQIQKAQREYFEKRVDELFKLYDPDLPPSEAWKMVICISIFEGLGISRNREPMMHVGKEVFEQVKHTAHPGDLAERALEISGLLKSKSRNPSSDLQWKSKGVRPHNRPQIRIPQASDLCWQIYQIPLNKWLQCEPPVMWENLLIKLSDHSRPGNGRSTIIYHIVLLPALWILGSLFHSTQLKNRTYDEWRNGRIKLPGSIVKLLRNSGFPKEIYHGKLGAVHQVKRYCNNRKCRSCLVLNSANNS